MFKFVSVKKKTVLESFVPRAASPKTDRRNALAPLLRCGELTATWVPERSTRHYATSSELARDAVEDHLRARDRLSKRSAFTWYQRRGAFRELSRIAAADRRAGEQCRKAMRS